MVKRNCRIVDLSRKGEDHDTSVQLRHEAEQHVLLPSSTVNLSKEVTLDCPYTFTTEERHSLVVEWFVNNQTPRSTGEKSGLGLKYELPKPLT